MMVDEWGFPHPSVDESACVGCARSVVVCPSLSEAGSDSALSAFWARSRDEGELVRSSSGGVFGLLAADVLASGGVVSVAAWGPGFRSVSHRPIEDPSDLDARVRSKYVQSSVSVGGLPGRSRRSSTREEGSIFGTACQVAGIRGHLAPPCSVEPASHRRRYLPRRSRTRALVSLDRASGGRCGTLLRGVNMRSKTTIRPSFPHRIHSYDAEKTVPCGQNPRYSGTTGISGRSSRNRASDPPASRVLESVPVVGISLSATTGEWNLCTPRLTVRAGPPLSSSALGRVLRRWRSSLVRQTLVPAFEKVLLGNPNLL